MCLLARAALAALVCLHKAWPACRLVSVCCVAAQLSLRLTVKCNASCAHEASDVHVSHQLALPLTLPLPLLPHRSEGDHGYKMSRSHTMPALHTAEGGEHKQHGSSSALEALIAIDSIQEEESITGDSTVMGDTTADEASGSCSPSHSSNTLRNSLERKRAVKPLFQRKVRPGPAAWCLLVIPTPASCG